jgi:hypothetical protein
MMMRQSLADCTINFLKQKEGEKFTACEIAEALIRLFPEMFQKKKDKSSRLQTDEDLLKQIAAEISAQRPRLQKKYPWIKTLEERPKKYFYESSLKISEESIEHSQANSSRLVESSHYPLESDLYPKLSMYLKGEYQVWSKRIDERRASNAQIRGTNRWLFPDLVGFEDFGSEWEREVKDCVQVSSEKQCRLWSFEVKRQITRGNVREIFFQSVSNSSWSHLGYVVAAEIVGEDTMKELRILSARHGVGVMKLDFENPSESQILIPALVRSSLDWDHINRLASENPDFRNFIRNVRHFHQTGDVRAKDWDYEG